MSGDRYVIQEQHATHFLTFTVMDWIDIFTRPRYKTIITDSLSYCTQEKGLEIYAWVLMTNHLHFVARANAPYKLSDVIRDFKKFTSKKIIDNIKHEPESRREWLLHKFGYHAMRTGRAKDYKVWQDGYHGIHLEGNKTITKQKIDYIHENPVRAMIVNEAQDYSFSSAGDYAGKSSGLVKLSFYD